MKKKYIIMNIFSSLFSPSSPSSSSERPRRASTRRNISSQGQRRRGGTRRTYGQSKNSKPIDPRERYIYDLKDLYPLCEHDNEKEKEKAKYPEHSITYGEMTYEGLETLYERVRPLFQQRGDEMKAFLDVGSGRGKLSLYMAAKEEIESSVGIELVESRVDDAERLLQQLSAKRHQLFTNKVKFINDDIFNIDLEDLDDGPTFVWFSNLCFDPKTTDAIYKKLVQELPRNSVICSSKAPSKITSKMKACDPATIPMSWNQASQVYIYQV